MPEALLGGGVENAHTRSPGSACAHEQKRVGCADRSSPHRHSRMRASGLSTRDTTKNALTLRAAARHARALKETDVHIITLEWPSAEPPGTAASLHRGRSRGRD